jgi:hypothetical protein
MPITTNAIARKLAVQQERDRCIFALEAQKQILYERIRESKNEEIKQAWTIAVIEIDEILKSIKKPLVEE